MKTIIILVMMVLCVCQSNADNTMIHDGQKVTLKGDYSIVGRSAGYHTTADIDPNTEIIISHGTVRYITNGCVEVIGGTFILKRR